MLKWIWEYKYLFEILISILLDLYSEMGMVDHIEVLFLLFRLISTIFFHNGCSNLHSYQQCSRVSLLHSCWPLYFVFVSSVLYNFLLFQSLSLRPKINTRFIQIWWNIKLIWWIEISQTDFFFFGWMDYLANPVTAYSSRLQNQIPQVGSFIAWTESTVSQGIRDSRRLSFGTFHLFLSLCTLFSNSRLVWGQYL